MPPTEGPGTLDPPAIAAGPHPEGVGWGDGEGRVRTLERLIGVRSSKPSFYAAWRDNAARLDRTIETMQRISAALCATPEGPGALCHAVVEAAAHHFDAPWAALCLPGAAGDPEPSHIVRRIGGRIRPVAEDPPPTLGAVIAEALEADAPVVVTERPAETHPGIDDASRAVAAPMPVSGERAGVLAVGLDPGAVVAPTDLSILVTLANHAGVALHTARLFEERERLRRHSESPSRLAGRPPTERRTDEPEAVSLRLESAGRRELLSQERNRIARELHDCVAQHLLTIGMNLEWCRRQKSTSGPVLERVSASQSLARSAVDEIRSVIFELASDEPIDLRRALREVITDVVAGTRLRVGLRTYGQAQPISEASQHALVQIAREALVNVVRHANADRAWLTLRWRPGEAQLAIADNGTGDPLDLQTRLRTPRHARGQTVRHFGLSNIGGRVAELAGVVSFRRRRGGGVRLVVQVPLGESGGIR